jgi:hypothetical protein
MKDMKKMMMNNSSNFNLKRQLVTAVWQDCEFCGKFTVAIRKKFYP